MLSFLDFFWFISPPLLRTAKKMTKCQGRGIWSLLIRDMDAERALTPVLC